GRNFDWSQNSVNGIYINDNSAQQTGFFYDFTTYISTYTTSVVYDHAAAITGYDYFTYDGTEVKDIAGRAWLTTLCNQPNKELSLSVNEFNDIYIHLTMSHELGHGFGMSHDDVSRSPDCPINNFIMSPGISSSDFIPSCLAPIDEGFFEEFCKGFVGALYSIDDLCKRAYGENSVRCNINQPGEANLQAGYVNDCVRDQASGYWPFYCTRPGDDAYCYATYEIIPSGSKCVLDGMLDPNN
ncbi:VM32A-like protein, partial [Mya arenaria]